MIHFSSQGRGDGYAVSAEMMKIWAVELDLLNELSHVCTVLGRHSWRAEWLKATKVQIGESPSVFRCLGIPSLVTENP